MMSMLKTYKHGGDKDTKIDKLEMILETKYHLGTRVDLHND